MTKRTFAHRNGKVVETTGEPKWACHEEIVMLDIHHHDGFFDYLNRWVPWSRTVADCQTDTFVTTWSCCPATEHPEIRGYCNTTCGQTHATEQEAQAHCDSLNREGK